MVHITKEQAAGFAAERRKESVATWKENFWEWAEFNRFSIIVVVFLVQSCIGGLAAGFGGMQDTFQLSVLVVGTIMSQALCIGVAPMKWIVPTFGVVTLINTILFIINIM